MADKFTVARRELGIGENVSQEVMRYESRTASSSSSNDTVCVEVPREFLTSFLQQSPQLQNVQQRPQYSLSTMSNENPGFCSQAWSWQHTTTLMGSDFGGDKYTCYQCGQDGRLVLSRDYVPRCKSAYSFLTKKFMAESHVPAQRDCVERRSCLICWEKKKEWVEPMGLKEWWRHIDNHLYGKENNRYIVCLNGKGVIQPRGACPKEVCQKVHSSICS